MTPFGEGFPTTRYPTFSGWGPISLILRLRILQMDANVINVHMYIHIHIMYEQGSLYASKKHTKQANENVASMKCDDLVLSIPIYIVCKWRTSATCHIFTNETGMRKVKRVKVPVQHQFSAFAQVEIPDTVVAKGTMFRSRRPTSDWRRQNQ